MYAYAAGSRGTFGAPSLGFGALAPASARGPIRLNEIKTALARVAAYPPIVGLLLTAQSAVAQMTETQVAYGEKLYMQAHALASAAGAPIALLRDLTVAPADTTPVLRETAGTITSILDTIRGVFQVPATPSQPAPPSTTPVDWLKGAPGSGVAQDLRGVLERPVGPLPLWQWVALGGAGLVAVGVATKMMRWAMVGGLAAAGAYGAVVLQQRVLGTSPRTA